MGQQDFAKLGSLPGFSMRTTLKSLHGFGMWSITTEFLYTLIKYLIIRSSSSYRHVEQMRPGPGAFQSMNVFTAHLTLSSVTTFLAICQSILLAPMLFNPVSTYASQSCQHLCQSILLAPMLVNPVSTYPSQSCQHLCQSILLAPMLVNPGSTYASQFCQYQF